MASAKFGEDTLKRPGPKPGKGASSDGGNRDVEGTRSDVPPRRPEEANERKAEKKPGTGQDEGCGCGVLGWEPPASQKSTQVRQAEFGGRTLEYHGK